MKPGRPVPEPIVWALWIAAASLFAASGHPVAAAACMGGLLAYILIRGSR